MLTPPLPTSYFDIKSGCSISEVLKVKEELQLPVRQNHYNVGDRVWIRHPSRRCNVKSLGGVGSECGGRWHAPSRP